MEVSTEQQILIEQRVTNEAKSTGLAYVLWFFLGTLAVHRFYLGSIGNAFLLLGLIWGGFLLSIAGFAPGLVLTAIGLVVLFFDLFFIPGMVAKDKNRVRRDLMHEAEMRSLRQG